jgi:hypothetical protein
MLVGAHAQRAGDAARGAAKNSRHAGCSEADVLGTKTQIIVFELGSPVIEEGIFQTEADQQAIQRGTALRGGANEGAVYIRCVPVKPASYPSGLALNKCPVKGDAKSPGNVVVPFVSDAGAFKQGAAIYPTKPVNGNFHPGPEAFTLDAENEHADLVVAADLATGETAHAVPITSQISSNTTT